MSRTQWLDVTILGAVYAFFTITAYKALAHLPLGLDGFAISGVIAAVLLLPIGYSHLGYFLGSPSLITNTLLVSVMVTLALGL